MRMFVSIGLIALAGMVWSEAMAKRAQAQEKEPLKLVQTIPLPNVKGRIDHMDVDVKGKRLFVAGLENGTLEVVDLKAGKWMRSIPGFKAPQGIAYLPGMKKIFVASNDDGVVRVFRSDTFELLDTIQLDLGPNRVAYDPHTDLLYVGYGGRVAKKDKGEVGIIDVKTNKHVGDIDVGLRAAEILMTKGGDTLFVFDNVAGKIQVIDTKKRAMTGAWQVSSERPGDGAFDQANHRLLIGTRTPPIPCFTRRIAIAHEQYVLAVRSTGDEYCHRFGFSESGGLDDSPRKEPELAESPSEERELEESNTSEHTPSQA